MAQADISIILTGGTIDKTYSPSKEIFISKQTHFNVMIEQARMPDVSFEIRQLMSKDSLEMTESDRVKIAEECAECESDKIVIVHGTSTMSETAAVIAQNNEIVSKKAIILFGAMVPFEHKESDAMFNFGMAVGAVQNHQAGIYIAMSGRVLPHNAVKKNVERAVFEAR
jgi:L-asparaginase